LMPASMNWRRSAPSALATMTSSCSTSITSCRARGVLASSRRQRPAPAAMRR
jgi:hypothetical protein